MSFTAQPSFSSQQPKKRSFVTELARTPAEPKDAAVSAPSKLDAKPPDDLETIKTHAAPADELQIENFSSDLSGKGNWWSASGHVITAVIGAGVLGLPNSVAWLGWIAGISLLVAFFAVTMWTSYMLTEVFEVRGIRHGRYRDAVKNILGRVNANILTVLQLANLILSGLGYVVAAGTSLQAVVLEIKGFPAGVTTGAEGPFTKVWQCCLLFGAIQVFVSQLPNLESAWWASAIGALMSIGYSMIALGLGLSQAGNMEGDIDGRPGTSAANKVWGCFQAIGNIAFAYNFSTLLLEIQDTLAEPPASKVSMKKSINLGIGCSFLFYVSVGTTGYMSQGDAVQGDVLVGFKGAPSWVLILANMMVVVHMVSAVQVYSQPVFQMMERLLTKRVAFIAARDPLYLRLVLRTTYIIILTVIAAAMPFFNVIISLIGALVFWPASVYFPVTMYLETYAPPKWQRVLMQVMNVTVFVVTLCALIGSVQGLISSVSTWSFFST